MPTTQHITSGNDTSHASAAGPDLAGYDLIYCSISGGKDSQAALDVTATAAAAAGVLDRVVAVHADLGRVEWPGTPELAREHADHYGIRFEIVARTGPDLLDRVAERGRWPDAARRWCSIICTNFHWLSYAGVKDKLAQIDATLQRVAAGNELGIPTFGSISGRDFAP